MGHEAIISGRIEGASWRMDENFRLLQKRNEAVLTALPSESDWPYLNREMFSLPAPEPEGTYREQVIHFGASLKDYPGDRRHWDTWIGKFEAVLRKLYWWSATVHLETDFEPDRIYMWVPADNVVELFQMNDPPPITEWARYVQEIHWPPV